MAKGISVINVVFVAFAIPPYLIVNDLSGISAGELERPLVRGNPTIIHAADCNEYEPARFICTLRRPGESVRVRVRTRGNRVISLKLAFR